MQKKTLVNTLNAIKKASLASAPAKNEGTSTRKTRPVRDARVRGS